MQIRYHNSQKETAGMRTQELRENFLIEDLMTDDIINLTYSHYDRVIIGGAKPVQQILTLKTQSELKADYFLERRELGIINVGGTGWVEADGHRITMQKLDCLYLGKGTKDVKFGTDGNNAPAFYLVSAPAHQQYPLQKMSMDEASPTVAGDQATANKRSIYKYIHAEGIQSAQLVMGLTILDDGNVWNTMPPHLHNRRMEAYFYFGLAQDHRVFHFMGQPTETRHLVIANHQAIISPPWSIHSGCGTSAYGFIWAMAGENYTYTDMDPVLAHQLR